MTNDQAPMTNSTVFISHWCLVISHFPFLGSKIRLSISLVPSIFTREHCQRGGRYLGDGEEGLWVDQFSVVDRAAGRQEYFSHPGDDRGCTTLAVADQLVGPAQAAPE